MNASEDIEANLLLLAAKALEWSCIDRDSKVPAKNGGFFWFVHNAAKNPHRLYPNLRRHDRGVFDVAAFYQETGGGPLVIAGRKWRISEVRNIYNDRAEIILDEVFFQ